MRLVENTVKGAFKPQHDRGQHPQIVADRILFGNYAFELRAEKFQGDLLSAYAAWRKSTPRDN